MSTGNATIEEEIAQPTIKFSTRFWIYLPLVTLSLISSIFVIYHMFRIRNLRSTPNNHVTIILLFFAAFTQLTMYPGMLHYYRLDGVWDRPFIMCVLWGYLDFTFYVTQNSLMALASIQRHILIFHERWMSTKFKRICIHYLPIIVILSYCLLIYAVVFFFPPCGYVYMYDSAACSSSCMWDDDIVFVYYDSIVHQILPVLLLTFFNIMLVARVIWRKYRMGQRVQWRKHRKMAVQFFMISSVYIICVLPYGLSLILYFVGITPDWDILIINIAVMMSYMPGLLLPVICSVALPEIREKFWRVIRCGRHTPVVPFQGASLTRNSVMGKRA